MGLCGGKTGRGGTASAAGLCNVLSGAVNGGGVHGGSGGLWNVGSIVISGSDGAGGGSTMRCAACAQAVSGTVGLDVAAAASRRFLA